MPFRPEHQLPDELEDPIGVMLREMKAHRSWSAAKQKSFVELERALEAEKYKRFTGDCRDYHLQRKGDSCVYAVPPAQRGALREFADKRVRLVCGGGWDPYSGRFYFAKPLTARRATPSSSTAAPPSAEPARSSTQSKP